MGTQWSVVGDSWQAVAGYNNESGRVEEEKGHETQKGSSNQCSITSAVTF